MESFNKHPLHLKIPELQTSDEVEKAVEKQERLTGEDLPNNPNDRIDAYMSRLENIFLNEDARVRERNLEMLRRFRSEDEPGLYDRLLTKKDVVIAETFKVEQRIAEEQGHGRIEITDEMINRPETQDQAEAIIRRQKESLDLWLDYLTSCESSYPAWFRYLLWHNITGLQSLTKEEVADKETGEKHLVAKYLKRNERTIRPFPDIFRGKISKIYETYKAYLEQAKQAGKPNQEIQEYFQRNFADTYARESLDQIQNSGTEEKTETRGQWVKYHQDNDEDLHKLVASLDGKYTDWCTEGLEMARNQLAEGDFYVYYTYDKDGQPTNPRIAIHCHGDQIGELRGVKGGRDQDLEDNMLDIANAKVKENFGEAEKIKYEKKTADMKKVTSIYKSCFKKDKDGELIYLNPVLNHDDLVFIYELESPIVGFGHQKDPRIAEIRAKRDLKEDLPILFDCTPDQIATSPAELSEQTLAYIGPWSPAVLKTLPPTVKYIYESFPDKKVFLKTIETDPAITSPAEARQAILAKGNKISDHAGQMLEKTVFSGEAHKYELVSFTVASLGFPNGATTVEIWAKGQELGLELCPAEVGPNFRLQYQDQPNDEYLWLAMDTITGADGYPDVWIVYRGHGEVWLDDYWAKPGSRWYADHRIVFVSRKD